MHPAVVVAFCIIVQVRVVVGIAQLVATKQHGYATEKKAVGLHQQNFLDGSIHSNSTLCGYGRFEPAKAGQGARNTGVAIFVVDAKQDAAGRAAVVIACVIIFYETAMLERVVARLGNHRVVVAQTNVIVAAGIV